MSLSVWIQQARRARCSANINARAILLVEKSVFQRKRIKHKKKASVDEDVQEEDNGQDDVEPIAQDETWDEDIELDPDEVENEDKGDDATFEWGKKVEDALRQWLETKGCQCDVVDEYFRNPPDCKCESNYHFPLCYCINLFYYFI